jgi:hypothetical protein
MGMQFYDHEIRDIFQCTENSWQHDDLENLLTFGIESCMNIHLKDYAVMFGEGKHLVSEVSKGKVTSSN